MHLVILFGPEFFLGCCHEDYQSYVVAISPYFDTSVLSRLYFIITFVHYALQCLHYTAFLIMSSSSPRPLLPSKIFWVVFYFSFRCVTEGELSIIFFFIPISAGSLFSLPYVWGRFHLKLPDIWYGTWCFTALKLGHWETNRENIWKSL